MKYSQGFTLIELMVVVGILGILATVAVPSYQDYVHQAYRTDAKKALTKMASAQEVYNLNNGLYASNSQVGSVGGTNTTEGYYTLAITNPSGVVVSYTLTATAVAGSPVASDTGCTVLVLTHGLQKTPADCW